MNSTNKNIYLILLLPLVALFLSSCSGKKNAKDRSEDTQAKQELQGIWVDDDTESPLMRIKGDTIYYSDSQTEPVYFKVIGDTLYTFGSSTAAYRIEKRMQYTLYLHSAMGEQLKLHKSQNPDDVQAFTNRQSPIPVYTSQVKKDTVLMYKDTRYRAYTYINPSRIKVMCSSVNEDGFQVDNVYYDNVMHICVYQGSDCLYDSDIKKQMFSSLVPADFLNSAILADMRFDNVGKNGFTYVATLQQPESYIQSIIDIIVGFNGKISMNIVSK